MHSKFMLLFCAYVFFPYAFLLISRLLFPFSAVQPHLYPPILSYFWKALFHCSHLYSSWLWAERSVVSACCFYYAVVPLTPTAEEFAEGTLASAIICIHSFSIIPSFPYVCARSHHNLSCTCALLHCSSVKRKNVRLSPERTS